MGQSDVPLPSVFGFLDVKLFLLQWFDAKLKQNPRYTYTTFARRAGCSAGHVRNVMNGQRKLLGRFVEGFINALRMEGQEAVYFSTLARYSCSTSVFERALLLRELAGIIVVAQAPMPQALALACWLELRNMTVLEAAHSRSFRDDPVWIAEALAILTELARQALFELKGAGLLKPDETGRLMPCVPTLATPPLAEPLVERLQRHGISSAADAVGGTSGDRHAAMLYAPVLAEDMEEVSSIIMSMIHRMNQALKQSESGRAVDVAGDRVYALQISLAPVSRAIGPNDAVRPNAG